MIDNVVVAGGVVTGAASHQRVQQAFDIRSGTEVIVKIMEELVEDKPYNCRWSK